jgi:hypothetical protein
LGPNQIFQLGKSIKTQSYIAGAHELLKFKAAQTLQALKN